MAYEGMVNDAALINKSGKLRALSYNMSQISNRMINQELNNNNDDLRQNLRLKINEFESILKILSSNNNNGIKHKETIEKLEKISNKWNQVFKPLYEEILNNNSTEKACVQINKSIDSFVINIDKMVTRYSDYSTGKVYSALLINAGLVIAIIILTIVARLSRQIPWEILMNHILPVNDSSYAAIPSNTG